LAEEATFLEMFMDEARLAARLNHPNIVQVYSIGSDRQSQVHAVINDQSNA
jgi:serine/threonine-protein kinase